MNAYDLSGKAALITGARRGIGRAIAERMANAGAKVAVADVNLQDCQNAADGITRGGGTAIALKLDITNEEDIIAAMESMKRSFGRIDILVNNAGIYVQQELEKMSTADIDRELDIDLRGSILCTKYALPEMKKNLYGKIVNIASTPLRSRRRFRSTRGFPMRWRDRLRFPH
jgi:NAD(P)-dependent dehydrogenase (short-subunit alcohol dehydrogenase family)